MRYYERNSHDGSWGVLGEPGRSVFFFPEGRTYSPPGRRPGGGSLPVGQTVRSARRMRLLREPTANVAVTAVPVTIVCAEWISAPIHSACENLPPAALSQKQGESKMIALLSLLRKRNR